MRRLVHSGVGRAEGITRVACCAAVTAVFYVHYLTRYFRCGKLNPFGMYCLLYGAAIIVYHGWRLRAS